MTSAPPHRRPRLPAALAAAGVCAAAAATLGAHAPAPAVHAPSSAATVEVATAAELKAALAGARAGQTIHLADGTYRGNFAASAAGTASAPVVLTGSAAAVLTASGGYGLHLDGASHWTVKGITVTGGQKGIVADSAVGVVIDGVTVHGLDMEGIHFRAGSSGGTVENSTIHDTGRNGRGMGEGVYIGTANTLTDKSDGVRVLNNTIGPDVRGENVDIKEGTTGGTVAGNTFDGSGLTNANYDDSWVDVKGNDWTVKDNTGTRTLTDGYQTHSQQDGWGCGTVFSGNRSDLGSAPGYAFSITNYDAKACPTTITADNTVTGGKGLVAPGGPPVGQAR